MKYIFFPHAIVCLPNDAKSGAMAKHGGAECFHGNGWCWLALGQCSQPIFHRRKVYIYKQFASQKTHDMKKCQQPQSNATSIPHPSRSQQSVRGIKIVDCFPLKTAHLLNVSKRRLEKLLSPNSNPDQPALHLSALFMQFSIENSRTSNMQNYCRRYATCVVHMMSLLCT